MFSGQACVLAYGGGLFTTPFEPGRLCMVPETGRLYHPAPAPLGPDGLVASALAVELGRCMTFHDEGAPVFAWGGRRFPVGGW